MVIRSSRAPARHNFSPPPASSVYRNIAFSFLGLTVLVVIGALWVSSVHARVSVKVKRDTTNVDTVIEIAKSPQQGQLRGRVVQGVFEKIQEFTVKERQDAPVDTTITQGTVRIVNNYSKPQTLVEKTRLLTADGRLYRIDKTVVLGVKESVLVSAHSDKAGKEYVLAPGVRMTIPGLWIDLQKWIYAETTTNFSGDQKVTRMVSAMDVKDAEETLEKAVLDQAAKTLKAEAGVGDEWQAVYVQKVVDSKTNVSAGQTSDQFLASVKLDVTAVYYPAKDMEVLVRQKLKDKIPDGRELIDYDPARIVYKVQDVDAKLEKARLGLTAQAMSRLTENSPQLDKEGLFGLTDEDAKAKLLGTDGVERVEIKIRPSWVHKLPSSKDKLDLVIE